MQRNNALVAGAAPLLEPSAMKTCVWSVWVGTVLSLSMFAAAAPPVGHRPSKEVSDLLLEHPGVRVHERAGRVNAVFGRPMTAAGTPLAAADAFVDRHIGIFGVGRPDLALKRVDEVGLGKSTVVVYEQTMDGLEVERSALRVLVLNGDPQRVVYANAHLAARPEQGFRPDVLTAEDAARVVSNDPAWAAIQEIGPARLVIWAGEGDEEQPVEAVRAWAFLGVGPGLDAAPIKYTFFVDASNGNLVHARDEILHGTNDVQGSVFGWGSPGLLPDIPANPPALLPMPEIRAQVSGGNNAFTDRMGLFSINNALPGPLSVMASVATGRWVSVSPQQGSLVTGAASGVVPPGPADIVLNPSPTQFTTAQVNAFIAQTTTHNYFRDRAPTFTALDIMVTANVNLTSTCNAFFDSISLSTNFYNEGGANPCVNSAYSSVVAHEYGHFIVNRLGLAQGAFGEGFSDTISMFTYDDQIIARNFRINTGAPIRDPDNANIPYPCPTATTCSVGTSHCCGQILGGTWWEIRKNFGNAYGEPTAIELVRQLHVDWALITAGGIGSNSAHPTTAVEVLTADDDDGNLDNGTPNFQLICAAFAQHNIPCPALALVDFDYPAGQPDAVSPLGTTQMRVVVSPIGGTPVPGSAEIFVSIDGGPFESAPAMQTSPNEYLVTFPAGACLADVNYYLRVQLQGGGFATDPPNAPADTYSTIIATAIAIPVDDDVETLSGWTLGVPGDTASTGQWEWGDPIGTAAQPEDDHTPDPGVNCYFTGQGTIGGTLGEADVDGGYTTLVTPVINLAGVERADISYWRWYSNNTGGSPNADIFVVDITNNGSTWVRVETVGPTGLQTQGGWFFHTFNAADFVALTSTVQVRFIAEDAGAGSLIEAAVDDFKVIVPTCVPPPTCPGDANGDLVVNFQDVTAVLANFGGPGPAGDADGNGIVDFGDITIILVNFLNDCR